MTAFIDVKVHIDRSRHQTNVADASTSFCVETFTDKELDTMRRLLEKAGVGLPTRDAKTDH